MAMILQTLLTIVVIAATFVILIAPHEGGHFLAAKLTRMRVIEFSLGMGPRIVSWLGPKTFYALRWLPIGGYVRIGGMEPGDYDDPQGFHAKPGYQRLFVLAAGPFVNFVVAALIVTGLLLGQTGDARGIQAVEAKSPAARAGIRPGDLILSIDGARATSVGQLRSVEQQHAPRPLALVVRKPDGQVFTATVRPTYSKASHAYLIGVVPELSVGDAILGGVTYPAVMIGAIVGGLYLLVSGQIPGGPFGAEGLTGPPGIAYMTSQAVHDGPLVWLNLVALLSVALGFFNLLPIPALDGGRIVVVLLEKLRGHPFDRDREMAVQRYALAALLTLVVVISYFDFQRILNHQFPTLH